MRRARGFTLVELVVTVAIVGLLATSAVPLVELTVKRTKEQELKAALREIRTAIDAYKLAADSGRVEKQADASGYPPDLDSLFEGVEDISNPEKPEIYFMRRLPRNPFFPDASAPADATWGLRSYESPPDDPEPGDDVYDVYALAPGTALDGTSYSDW